MIDDKPIEITRPNHEDTKSFLENIQSCLTWHRQRMSDLEQAIIAIGSPTIFIRASGDAERLRK